MRVIDLFAGVGGLSYGFSMSNFDIVFAVEHDKEIANTFKKNHPDTDVFSDDIETLDVIFETFKFSNYNKEGIILHFYIKPSYINYLKHKKILENLIRSKKFSHGI